MILLLLGQAMAEDLGIAGRYKHRGRRITHRIAIPLHPPAAAIVVQHLPPGTVIEKSVPAYSSYDVESGTVKWLFPGVQPGTLKIRIILGERVEPGKISAEVLFKERSGESNTFTVQPSVMRSTAIEGC
jgi:hypothetical protein